MRQEIISMEREIACEKVIVDEVTVTVLPPQRFKFAVPVIYNWFKVIPYKDGLIHYDRIKTILYFKKDGFIELYVRTNHSPADLTEMGYPILKSPADILGDTIVYGCTLFAKYKHDYHFVDFIINNMNRFFRDMPNYTALAVHIHTPEDLKW